MPLNLNEYLLKSVNLLTLEQLFTHFESALDSFGYDSAVFLCFPPRKDAGEVIPTCPYFNVSTDLISEYLSNKLYTSGPVFEYIRTTGLPITWSDVFVEGKIKKLPEIEKYIKLLSSRGYHNGVAMPVFGVGNSFGFISLASHQKAINIKLDKNIIVQHVCIDLMRQYIRITKIENGGVIKLTRREKEVLTWVLKGKSNSVIAQLMNISEHTVSTYIKRSTKKLNASSKWSAALTAVLIGLIQY